MVRVIASLIVLALLTFVHPRPMSHQLFCTGQKPCTSYLSEALPAHLTTAVDQQSGMAKVNRHLQLAVPPPADRSSSDPQTRPELANTFVIGDAADAFGALNAGHTAWDQAAVAAGNICSMIKTANGEKDVEPMQVYTPPQPAIKVSLGLDEAISQTRGVHSKKKGQEDGCHIDLNTGSMWTRRGLKDGGELGDYRE